MVTSSFNDETGFAAVNAYFGGEASAVSSNNDALDRSGVAPPVGAHRFMGVGAKPCTQKENPSTNVVSTAHKQILRIGGSTKRNQKSGFGLDADHETVDLPSDSEDEEDQGRTTAIAETKSSSIVAGVVEAHPSKKTRKQPPKTKEAAVAHESSKTGDPKRDGSENAEQRGGPDPDQAEMPNDPIPDPDSSTGKSKRKRRKVRSRQKNIRKDHRDVKPAHLQNSGRPLTVETRLRLQAPTLLSVPLESSGLPQSPFQATSITNTSEPRSDTACTPNDSATAVEELPSEMDAIDSSPSKLQVPVSCETPTDHQPDVDYSGQESGKETKDLSSANLAINRKTMPKANKRRKYKNLAQ
jgi:hypothetical protein